ncbi:MAG: Rrf2 family transcriptional regulator [Rhodothermales bacterium]|nr:Rrf2 family transcriptional regulator [Rhodothermales bacterium]
MLSKSCSYGLRAAILLAQDDWTSYTPIRELSARLGISFHFLTKILQQLTVARILVSHKGPKGGVALARRPDTVTVYDIVLAIDGPDLFNECILGLPGCGMEEPCPLHGQWSDERSRIESMMKTESIAALATEVISRRLRLGDVR